MPARWPRALTAAAAVPGGIGFAVFNASKWDELTYLQWSNRGVVGLIQYIFIYFLLNYQFIPVSLYVSLSMVYTIQRWFMVNDPNMFDGVNEEPPLVRTMNLNDELGQVSYIFSDKTGTLTGNLMEFRKCNIAGVNYGSGTTDIGLARMRGEHCAPHGAFAAPRAQPCADHQTRACVHACAVRQLREWT